jgi:hypothetical protein
MSDIHVYVIATIIDGKPVAPCKIGVSARPDGRVWALQTACPNELRLLCSFAMPNRKIANDVEGCFHHTRKDRRLRGEWFDLDPDYAATILKLQIRWAIEAFTNLSAEELELAYEGAGVNS